MFKSLRFQFSKLFSSKFILKGKCKKCGKCCRNIVFYIEDKPIKTKEQFEKLKEWKKSYKNFYISGIDDDEALLFTCKSLNENNTCRDYMFRAIGCRNYPKIDKDFIINGGKPLDGCGYYFGVDKDFRDYLNN